MCSQYTDEGLSSALLSKALLSSSMIFVAPTRAVRNGITLASEYLSESLVTMLSILSMSNAVSCGFSIISLYLVTLCVLLNMYYIFITAHFSIIFLLFKMLHSEVEWVRSRLAPTQFLWTSHVPKSKRL